MKITIDQLLKNITDVDTEDILSSWMWRMNDMEAVIAMSVLGDLFLLGRNNCIYWLQTDGGELTKVAESLSEFEEYLKDRDKIDEWFLPMFIEQLLQAGKTLKENEVYSFIKPPMLGGDYLVENIQATDMSVHFAFMGQIAEQIQNLPDGTPVNIKFRDKE